MVEDMAARAQRPVPDAGAGGCSGSCTWRRPGTRPSDCTYGLEDFANYFGGAPASCRWPTVDDKPKTKREFVEVRGVGQRRHRHAGRRHRLHRRPPGAVGRVRHVPAARPRLGRARGDDALVPALRPGGHPHFKGQLASTQTSHEWAISKRTTSSAGPGRRSWTPSRPRRGDGGGDERARREGGGDAQRRRGRPRRCGRPDAGLRRGAGAGACVRDLRL